MKLNLSGNEVLVAFAVIFSLMLITILLIRLYLQFVSKNLHSDKKETTNLSSRTKHSKIDIYAHSRSILGFGVITALLLSLVAFSWTTYDNELYIPELIIEPEDIVVTPRTANPKPPPPPLPPPPKIEIVVDHLEVESPTFVDTDVEAPTVLQAKPKEKPVLISTPLPPPIIPEDGDEIVPIAEQMPRFPGCENEPGDHKSKEKCAQQKLLEYIYNHLKYPTIARENGVEGMCVIQFVVSKEGEITNVKLVRDIGAGCGEAAKTVVESMNDLPDRWTPGRQRGRKVKVIYTLPVRFKLEN